MAVLLLSAGCGTKKTDKDISLGMTFVNRAIDYQLKGNEKMATYSYNRAISKFRDMGSFCNMARTSLIIATIDPEESLPLLEDARAFATLGHCKEELNITNFLSKNEYDKKALPEPYYSLAMFYDKNDNSYLMRIINSQSTSDRVKSFVIRLAVENILEDNPKKALKLIEDAVKIDSKKAWTLNLVKDERLRLRAVRLLGLPDDVISQRLKILEQAIDEKY